MTDTTITKPGFWKRIASLPLSIWENWKPLGWLKDSSSWVEVFSGTMGWIWGILLLLPFDTFGITASYVIMEWMAPEEVWALFFIMAGILHSLSVCAGFERLRYSASWFGALLWAFVGTLFALAIPTGIAPWIWLSLSAMLVLAGIKNGHK